MDRQQELEREVEFLRKLVVLQNEMVARLLAERVAAPQPQIVPMPYPVPAPCPGLPPVPPYIPIYPCPGPWVFGPGAICQADGGVVADGVVVKVHFAASASLQ